MWSCVSPHMCRMQRAYRSGGIAAVAESAWAVTSANASGDTSVADGWEVVMEDDQRISPGSHLSCMFLWCSGISWSSE